MGGFFTKIFSKLSGKKELKIIIIGLDNSGKTTILSIFYHQSHRQTPSQLNQVNRAKYFFLILQPSASTCKPYNIKTSNSKSGTSVDKTLSGTFILLSRYPLSSIPQTILVNVLPLHQRHPLRSRQQRQATIRQSRLVTLKSPQRIY